MGWEGDVLNKNVNRLKVDVAKEAKGGILNLLGAATGGLLGTQTSGQQPAVDRNGVLPRAATTGAEASKQANESLKRFGQQHGIGVPEQTGQTGLGKFLGDIGDAFSRRILPSGSTVDRLKNGASAAAGTVTGIVAGGAALVQDGVNAVGKATSKPTAEEIAKQVAEGKLDGHEAQRMINAGQVQLPDAKTIKHQKPAPIETAVPSANPAQGIYVERGAPGQAAVAVNARAIQAEADKPSLLDRFKNFFSSGTDAAVDAGKKGVAAVTVAVASATATAQPPEPPKAAEPTTAVATPVALSTFIPQTTVSNTPVIPTTVTPTTDFKVAAAAVDAAPQVKPSQTPTLDAMIDATKDASRLDTLTKARAFVTKPAEPGGMN